MSMQSVSPNSRIWNSRLIGNIRREFLIHNQWMEYLLHLQTQMRLEGLNPGLDGHFTINDPNQEDQPLLLLARLADRNEVVYINMYLPEPLRDLLWANRLNFQRSEWLVQTLSKNGIAVQTNRSKTYIFPSSYLHTETVGVNVYSRDEPIIQDFGFGGLAERVYAIERRGKIASACVSVREDNDSAEAWVCTSPEERGNGFARRVTAAWGRAVLESNKVPFYSHLVANLASAGLANRLGLREVFEEMGVERV
jgi:hypothetical protein